MNIFLVVFTYMSLKPRFTTTFWARIALGTVRRFRRGTARLHLSFCRDGLKIGTVPSTEHWSFPRHGSDERLHLRKSWHGTLIGVLRSTYLVVLGTAKNAEPTLFTLSEFAMPCWKKAAPVQNIPNCRAISLSTLITVLDININIINISCIF